MKYLILVTLMMVYMLSGCAQKPQNNKGNKNSKMETFEKKKTDEEWRKLLSPVQFNILREKGTERAFTGEYDTLFEEGVYFCAACGAELFSSKTKFNSGCGWPSFYDKSLKNNILERVDKSYGMNRTEVLCAKCEGHLGHVFTDGPEPTGLRYCINSPAMIFKSAKELEAERLK